MIKHLLSATLFLFFITATMAQQAPTDSTLQLYAAINGEQMLEKMGFENLMKAVFDQKAGVAKSSATEAAEKATVRKALAAIYGAGINFNKKMWLITGQRQKSLSSFNTADYRNMESPLRLFVIPVANRQVMQENIIKIITTVNPDKEVQPIFDIQGDIAWLYHRKTLLLLSNTELLAASLPGKLYDYNDEVYNGITVRSDTVVNHVVKGDTSFADGSIDVIDKPADIKEIDKLLPTGKIKRLYTYKDDSKKIRFTPPRVAKSEEIKEEAAVAAVDTVVVADTAAVAVAPATDEATAARDTLIRTEYLNDSTVITHYYLPYSDAERDALNARYDSLKQVRTNEKIRAFVANYKNYLPKTDNAIIQQLATDTADIIYYTDGTAAAPYNYMSFLIGAGKTKLFNQHTPVLTSISFNNGVVKMITTNNCCGDTSTSPFSNMYKPLTNFWPAALGKPILGHVHYNLNMPQLVNYINGLDNNLHLLSDDLKRQGVELQQLQQLFSGEVAMALHAGNSKRGKMQPRMLIALKLQDAASAVKFMNTIGSRNLRSTQGYRFDENAGYLLIDSDAKNGVLTAPAVAAVPLRVPEGSMGNLQFNIKAMLNSFTKDTKKTQKSFIQSQQFFGNLQINSVKNANAIVTTVTADMGSAKNNALYNLLQLMSNGGGNGNMLSPLRSILR